MAKPTAVLDLPIAAPGVKLSLSRRALDHLTGWALSLPALFLMAVLLIAPVIAVVALSFTDWSLGDADFAWIGAENYREMLGEETFRKALLNTFIYAAIVVPGSVMLGLGAALLIESLSIGKGIWRSVYFLPVMSTLIAMAIVWEFLLHPKFGLLALTLSFFGIDSPFWLTTKETALFALCAIAIWQTIGFNMVLFMAGLTSIPRDLYDALEVDGARTAWDRFWTVTWPLLSPVTMFVVVISAIRSFQVFDTVHVLTQGGPDNASMVLVYAIYQEAFEFFRSSYAAGLTVVFLIFIFILTLVKVFFIEKRVHYS